ncbi:MAG: histidine phosphatase family protein [Anaerolineales bacterium]
MNPLVPIVYLIRHATPDWSRTDIPYFAPPGPPLTAQGQNEAAQLGVFLREARVAHIYASPFERAWRTAQIAAAIANAPIQQIEGLAEWQPSENANEIRARFWPAWEQACGLSAQLGPVALITHGGPIGFLLEELGLDKDVLAQHRRRFDRNNPLPPAGAWKATHAAFGQAWDLSLTFVPEKDGRTDVAYL